ncbi:MAG: hypothetical protein AAF743_02420 [Planctomycetota bacterium]
MSAAAARSAEAQIVQVSAPGPDVRIVDTIFDPIVFDLTLGGTENRIVNFTVSPQASELAYLDDVFGSVPVLQSGASMTQQFKSAGVDGTFIVSPGFVTGNPGDNFALTVTAETFNAPGSGATSLGTSTATANINLLRNRVITGNINGGTSNPAPVRHMISQSIGTLTLNSGADDDFTATRTTISAGQTATVDGFRLTNASARGTTFNGANQTANLEVHRTQLGEYTASVLPDAFPGASVGNLIVAEQLKGAALDLSGVELDVAGTAVADRRLSVTDKENRFMQNINPGVLVLDGEAREVFTSSFGGFGATGDRQDTRFLTGLGLDAFTATANGITAGLSQGVDFETGTARATVVLNGSVTLDTSTLGTTDLDIDVTGAIRTLENGGLGLAGENTQTVLTVPVSYAILADNTLSANDTVIYSYGGDVTQQSFANNTVGADNSTSTHTRITADSRFTPTSLGAGTVNLTIANGGITPEGIIGERPQDSLSYGYRVERIARADLQGTPFGTTLGNGDTLTLTNVDGPSTHQATADVDFAASGRTDLFGINGVAGPGLASGQGLDRSLLPGQTLAYNIDFIGGGLVGEADALGRTYNAYLTVNRTDRFDESDIFDDGNNIARPIGQASLIHGSLATSTHTYTLEHRVDVEADLGTATLADFDLGDEGLTLQQSTRASLIDSLLISGEKNITIDFRNTPDAAGTPVDGDIVRITGLDNTLHVLQLSFDNTAGNNETASAELLWQDDDNQWVNAVLGNSNVQDYDLDAGTVTLTGGATVSLAEFLDERRFEETSYGAYLFFEEGNDPTLGDFGYDSESGTVWAVIDHNSLFGGDVTLTVIPEPVALLGGILGMGGLLLRRSGSLA